MDALLRNGRLLLRARAAFGFALGGLALVLGCAAPPLHGVGRATDAPGVATASSASPDGGATPSPIPLDFKTQLARVGADSFVSWGHAGGRYSATVYVTPAAKSALFQAGADVTVGTEVVMTDIETASHKPGPSFFMLKDAPIAGAASGEWRYGIMESPGAKASELTLCARCHAEAPHDHVFALPE